MLVSETDTAYYETFPDALKEANKQPSARLTLLDDVSFEGKAAVQTIKTNLSIDLNGYTLGDSLTSDRLFSLAINSLTLRIFSSRPNATALSMPSIARKVVWRSKTSPSRASTPPRMPQPTPMPEHAACM